MADKPVKNDLSQLLKSKGPILKPAPEKKNEAPVRPRPALKTSRKPRKAEKERVSERIQTLLTKTEAQNLSDRAGDVSISKYIRLALKRAGEI